jgi:NtrC-family two-component system sensor histidine kinase KinB
MNPERTPLQLLYEISRQLAKTLDLRTVLSDVLLLCIENVGAERGSVFVLDDMLHIYDAILVLQGEVRILEPDSVRSVLQNGLAGWVIQNRKAALISNTRKDLRWLSTAEDDHDLARSAICTPLMVQDRMVGIMTIMHAKPNFFIEKNLALVQAIADQAGVAIHNALLHQSLQAATHRYRELFNDSIDPLLISDLHGKVIEANRQASIYLGAGQPGLVDEAIEGLHIIDREKLGANFENIGPSETLSYESTLISKNGHETPVLVYVRRVNFADEEYLKWVFRDISERKELDRMREDLTAMIYHDLRSPMSNIISSLDMLGNMIPAPYREDLRPILQIANRSVERMQRLTSSLLDINLLEAGNVVSDRKAVAATDLLREACESVQAAVDSRQQTLETEVDPHVKTVLVDADMIRRVIINLLENAAKFTPNQGRLRAGIQKSGSLVLFFIEDSGPGIPSEDRERIFEKFVRLHSGTRVRGMGLGLAFCRLAVQAHGGKIWMETHEQPGSRFVFTLPAEES